MKHFYWAIWLVIANFYHVSAQQQAPHISGKVSINLTEGLIKCDLKLSNLPNLGKQYKLLLYRGFNIKHLRNDTGRVLQYDGFYNDKLHEEAAAYVPTINDDTLPLPAKLSLSYTGAFPVYTDTLNSFDFKGFIAFNGKTVRATEQSKWYPVIYDVKNDKEIFDVSYDIDVECRDCKTIYINGAKAQNGPSAKFTSELPKPLLLFAGNYAMQPLSNSTFLNADLTDDEAKVFDENINTINIFYKEYLNIPYGEKITFLQHKAVEPFGPKRSWGFVTFPTIAIAGTTLKSQINVQSGLFKDTAYYRFYSHEMGHYYFGQLLQSNSTLRWFFLESMAEFLSIKATEAKYGAIATQGYIAEKKSLMSDFKIEPLSQISSQDSLGDRYRYSYAPLILLAMEKKFGAKAVQSFCQKAIQNAGKETNYSFLLALVKSVGITDSDWKLFEGQVINQRDCVNIFKYI